MRKVRRSVWVGGPKPPTTYTTSLGNQVQVSSEGPPSQVDLLLSFNVHNKPVYRRQPVVKTALDMEQDEEQEDDAVPLPSTQEAEDIARKLKSLTMTTPLEDDKELQLLFDTLPESLRNPIIAYLNTARDHQLVEIVIDVGRPPVLWFQDDKSVAAQRDVEEKDMNGALEALLAGSFSCSSLPCLATNIV